MFISNDQASISVWASECFQQKLYRADGVAQECFAGKRKIHLMAYLPGVGWAMYHDLGSGIHGSVYVAPDLRRRGFGRQLSQLAWKTWMALQQAMLAVSEIPTPPNIPDLFAGIAPPTKP